MIVGYTYRSENRCPGCTLDALNVPQSLRDEMSPSAIVETLAEAAGIDLQDERSFDSGEFPKPIHADQLLPEGETCDVCDKPLGDE